MAHETVTKSSRFYCISLIPDFCKTPVGPATPPLPYTIKGEFAQTTGESKNVKSHSEPVFLHNKSVIPSVTGDEPGVAKGIKSNTVSKRVETLQFSSTLASNNTKTTQEGRMVWMNDRNTVGQIYERGKQNAKPLQQDWTAKFEQQFTQTAEQVKGDLQALSQAVNQKVKQAEQALVDTGHSILDGIQTKIEQTREALKPLARKYKGEISESMHQFGRDAMDTGGKVTLAGGGIALAGAGVAATGVGAPVAVGMEVAAGATATTGAVVTGVGATADSGATLLDNAADWILTGKTPDLKGAAISIGQNVAESVVLSKAAKFVPKSLREKIENKLAAKKKKADEGTLREQAANRNGSDGGKNAPTNKPPTDPPKPECPKTCAVGGKPATSDKPVYYATGEEILHHTDFSIGGAQPLVFTRTWRSSSEALDWGPLGARWGSEFTQTLSSCKRGMVLHDDTGRSVRLPPLQVGEQYDHPREGLLITRPSDDEFQLEWRDGTRQIHRRVANGVLPHGYDAVLAVNPAKAPLVVRRYALVRRQARDGRGYSVQHYPQAEPGQIMLQIRLDDGQILDAIRATQAMPPSETSTPASPVIGSIEQTRADGVRVVHARYDYAFEAPAAEPSDTWPTPDAWDAPHPAYLALPPRLNLVAQSSLMGHTRRYGYRHHLLTRQTDYNGQTHVLDWISFDAVQERWRGSDAPWPELAAARPIHLGNSRQARVLKTACEDGSWAWQFDYAEPDMTRCTEPDGNLFEYHFDHQWLYTRVLQYLPGQTRPIPVGRRRWNNRGELLEEIDAEHHTTRFEYDAAGNVTASTDPLGRTTRTEYNNLNLPTVITDAAGGVARIAYDQQGRPTGFQDALGRVSRYQYDAAGRIGQVIDAKGGSNQLSYDAHGNLQSHTDCSGFTTRYEYDAAGNLTAQINAIGQATRYRYDAINRLIGVQHPDGTREQMEWDAAGNLTAHIDGAGHATRYRYNGHDQPVERTDANGNRLQYRYDAALRLIELINGNGDSYRFTYHPQGWLKSETGFDGKETSYTYDAAGRLTSSNAAGQKTEFARDAAGQLLAKLDGDGLVRYAYDVLGRLTAVAAPHAEHRFMFDAVGQLREERSRITIPADPAAGRNAQIGQAWVLQHEYDELGNRIATTLPNGRKIDTLRYGSGHWHGTLWQGQSLIDVNRDALHRETRRTMGQHLEIDQRWDAQSRLAGFNIRKGQSGWQRREYQYDRAGNLTTIADSQRGIQRYEYDPLGQLLSALQPDIAERFAFDPAGNLLDAPDTRPSRTNQPDPETAARPAVGIAQVTHNLLKRYADVAYEYDIQGNTVLKRPISWNQAAGIIEQRYAYDAQNRLSEIHNVSPYVTRTGRYWYDAFGRRIAKQASKTIRHTDRTVKSQEEHLTFFVWDGDVMVQEMEGDDTSGIVRSTTFVYEPDSFVPAARIESDDAEEIYAPGTVHLPEEVTWLLPTQQADACAHVRAWEYAMREQQHAHLRQARAHEAEQNAGRDRILHYQTDHLGTPLELLTPEGETVWSAAYKAWGAVQREHNPHHIRQPLRFQGQYADEESGLHYNRHRYYDPATARFVTQDPIGLLGGENVYQYAPNGVSWIDPLGQSKSPAQIAADRALCSGREKGAAAQVTVGNHTETGVSGTKIKKLHPKLRKLLSNVPIELRAPWHGGCGEIRCLNKLFRKGIDPTGGTGTAVNIGNSGKGHGTPKQACSTCAHIFKQLNICDTYEKK